MSPQLSDVTGGHVRFPRVSGDEPLTGLRLCLERRFSPRERG